MIRLPATHAAITAPLVASTTRFPGIPIGRSETDGRPFSLSPVLVDAQILPATNSLGLGGLGSGKSTTGKLRARREVLKHRHQYVVIDSYGEQSTQTQAQEGEWAPLTRSLGGQVIEAGAFTLNPCSAEFPDEVREQLVRSLIGAVEPTALTPQAAHALQHALASPKASGLSGLVDALLHPEDGRWPAAKLAEWGEGAAIALDRYTEGSLRGLFDGPSAGLPETNLPIISFDFTRLDRNSPAIPALMAAVACWVEHVWLKQSTAVHRHLVIEEAWQILLSPSTAELIQRLLKNSRKAGLSLDVIMHTLSDLGEGRAQDLARLCDLAYVGRLGPEEAAIVGAILGLPEWAIKKIPRLTPGQAIWKVGQFVDVIKTAILDEDEAELTDTSKRRREAQQAAFAADAPVSLDKNDDEATRGLEADFEYEEPAAAMEAADDQPADALTFALPPTVIDTVYSGPQLDDRHLAVLEAARAGRLNEAADLAAVGERQDISTHGLNSAQAAAWLVTRAEVADLSGNPTQAAHLRATVTRMGNNEGAAWFETYTDNDTSTPIHQVPEPPTPAPMSAPMTDDDQPQPRGPRRAWPYVAAVAALALTTAVIWQQADDDQKAAEQAEQVASYKGVSATNLNIDGVKAETLASWSKDGRSVVLSASVDWKDRPKIVRIDSADQTAKEETHPLQKGEIPMPIELEVEVPVKSRYQAVRLTIAVGGPHWKAGTRAQHREIEFRPDRTAIDTKTGKRLKQEHSSLL
ncbi:hypothetical protein [Streptomyces sp. NPDC046821]|uniref:hypothetical protein n=1 Tax=Streptomyces sp. NPDC046821 TaxID=3154702 RepID=UPI0033F94733